jgi:hypothetical protein
MGRAFGQITATMPYPYFPAQEGGEPSRRFRIPAPTQGQKKALFGIGALPILIALGYGGLILTRMTRARLTEGGEGEAVDEPEIPTVVVPNPTDPRCAAMADQLNTPAGCGLVRAKAYKAGKEAQVVLKELPGRPGFYLQTSPVNAYDAFVSMENAIKAAGIKITVNSSFRTMAKQTQLYKLYRSGKGALAAAPGRSNHQFGTTVDLSVKANPKLFAWLKANGPKYGFHKTVAKEDWHWDYLGK